MSEDAIDAMIERMAREEQDDLDRRHGQAILDQVEASRSFAEARGGDILSLISQAYKDREAGGN